MKKLLVAALLMLLVNMGFSVVSNAVDPRSWNVQPDVDPRSWIVELTVDPRSW